jgi:Chlororespiratory reduction 6
VSPVLMEIPRAWIEAGDFSEAEQALRSPPDEWIGNIGLVISGYEDDPRELWEVPEVRRWFSRFVAAVPHLLMFLSPEWGSSKLYFALLLEELDNEHLLPALEDAFQAMNAYIAERGIDAERLEVAGLPDRIVRSLAS